MQLKLKHECDVLVLGSGIAGIMAALTAAEAGKHVILACEKAILRLISPP